jgi:hypothetical protein
MKKEKSLSTQALDVVRDLRESLDQRGGAARSLLMVGDGSFANKTMFKAELDRTNLLARCRKDARLCFPAHGGGRRKYAQDIFTPDRVRTQEDRPWQRARVYLGGKWRMVRYKELIDVLWKRGAGTRRLRLIVIAPVPYKLSKNSRLNYLILIVQTPEHPEGVASQSPRLLYSATLGCGGDGRPTPKGLRPARATIYNNRFVVQHWIRSGHNPVGVGRIARIFIPG